MKRIISTLLVCILVISLAACGGTQSENTGSTLSGNSRAESSAEDTAEDNEEYPVIRINETAFYGGPPANGDLIEDALNEILREKAHAEIEFVYVQMSDL